MNIAYFINSLSNAAGMERIITDKANALSRRPGVKVFIVCMMASEKDTPAYELAPEITLISLGLTFDPGTTDIRRNPIRFVSKWLGWRRRVRSSVDHIIDSNSIDIAILSTYDAALPSGSRRCPHILESHAFRNRTIQMSAMPIMRKYLTSRHVRKADVLVALTEADAALWPEARRVEVIGNFTNIRPAAPYDPDTKRIMAAGRLDPQKGFDILVDAWRTVARKHPDWTLDIYGPSDTTGRIHADLQSRINEAGLSHSITLCGVCRDMARAYSEHSAFVLSSRFEGFGLVLLEAMACGVPCVSFDCPHGPSEIITDGSDGLLVPFRGLSDSKRAEALAESLCRMIESRDMRLALSDAAIKKAATFGRDAIIDRWIELFRSIIDKNA